MFKIVLQYIFIMAFYSLKQLIVNIVAVKLGYVNSINRSRVNKSSFFKLPWNYRDYLKIYNYYKYRLSDGYICFCSLICFLKCFLNYFLFKITLNQYFSIILMY